MQSIETIAMDSDDGGQLVNFMELIPREVRESIEQRQSMSDAERAAYDADRERRRIDQTADRLRPRFMAESGLTGDMLQCRFDAFDIRHERQQRLLDMSRRFVAQLPSDKPGLAIWGPTGRGKSHLARGIVIAAIERRIPIRAHYLICINIGRKVRAEKDLVGRVLGFDLLVLDDIEKGLSGDTPEWGSAAVKDILEHADSEGKPKLVITSECPVRTIYNKRGEALVIGHDGPKRQPPWLCGRLEKLCHWEMIDGPNGRDEQYWIDDGENWW